MFPSVIKSTTDIFTYDLQNGNSLSDYNLDQKNLLFLGRLVNDVIIGAYSKQSFAFNDEENEVFLFSIHPNYEVHKLTLKAERKNKLTVKLDKNFLIFGSN